MTSGGTQSYKTHAHQPVLTYVATGGFVVALIGFVVEELGVAGGRAFGLYGLLVAIGALVSISRAYTTRLQDRIIMLEERLRAERLLTPAQLAHWDGLGVKQVVALRFASDAEFASLFDRTLAERLAPRDIKRAIKEWRADERRT